METTIEQTPQKSTRVFQKLQQTIGDSGNYQNMSLLLWMLFFFSCGSTAYLSPFLFYQQDYICQTENCHEFVCSLPIEERSAYIDPRSSSFASKFGDFRCQKSAELDQMQSFIYFGGIVGVFLGSFITKYVTKKKLLVLTVIANIVGVVFTIFADTLFLAAIGLFLNFAAIYIQLQVIPCIITETVVEERCGRHIMIIYTMLGIGSTANGVIFMLIQHWEVILLTYKVLPFVVMLFGVIFYIEETPFDTVVNYSPEESLRAFKRVAKINNKREELTVQVVSLIKEQYEENQRSKHNTAISAIDLLRYDSLRNIVIVSVILRFFVSYEFNVPELVLKDYALDIHWGGIILGFSEILASVVCYFMVDHYQRKKMILLAQILGLVIALPILFFASCHSSVDECGVLASTLQIVGLFMFRSIITIGDCFFHMSQYEMFPIQIRSIALQVGAVFTALAIVVSPLIEGFLAEMEISMISTFCVACVIITMLSYKMPETFKVIAPEIIKELQYEDKIWNEKLGVYNNGK